MTAFADSLDDLGDEASRSFGDRLVMMPSSVATSTSLHRAPALTMSVLMEL